MVLLFLTRLRSTTAGFLESYAAPLVEPAAPPVEATPVTTATASPEALVAIAVFPFLARVSFPAAAGNLDEFFLAPFFLVVTATIQLIINSLVALLLNSILLVVILVGDERQFVAKQK